MSQEFYITYLPYSPQPQSCAGIIVPIFHMRKQVRGESDLASQEGAGLELEPRSL